MPRPRTPGLTDGEARLMAVLWARGRATVAEVQAGLKRGERVTYSTVQTMLRILEQKGYVAHEKAGRAFIYRPLVDERQARRKALRHMLARLFENSPSLLVLNVLEDERTSPEELARLKQLIRDA
jgi:predicted transcriptional regulator